MINENKTIAFWNKKLLRGCRLFRHRFRLRCLNRFNISPAVRPAAHLIYTTMDLMALEEIGRETKNPYNIVAKIVDIDGKYAELLPKGGGFFGGLKAVFCGSAEPPGFLTDFSPCAIMKKHLTFYR